MTVWTHGGAQSNWIRLHSKMFIAVHQHFVSELEVVGSLCFRGVALAVIRVQCGSPKLWAKCPVIFAVIGMPLSSEVLPAWLVGKLNSAVYHDGVRVITGVFGRTQKQMSSIASWLPIATRFPLCQEWKGPSSAVADLQEVASYTLLLGSCSKVTTH